MYKDYPDFLITVSVSKIVWIALAHPVSFSYQFHIEDKHQNAKK